MRTQIASDIYRGQFYIDLFSKIAAVLIKSAVVITVLLLVLLPVNRQVSAQNVESIKWENDIKKACQTAQLENRLILIHFYSDCAPCISMNANVFSDPRIAIEMNRNFVAVRADMKTQAILAKQFDVTVVPTDLILNSAEQIVYRRQGEIAAEKYLQFLQYLRNNYLKPRHVNVSQPTHLSNDTNINNAAVNNANNAAHTSDAVVHTSVPNSFPANQTDPRNISNEKKDPFDFVNTAQSNQSITPSNLSYSAVHSHPVISASGQIDPTKNNSNVVTVPSNTGHNSSLPHAVTSAVPIVSNSNDAGFNDVRKESVINNNINNGTNLSNANYNTSVVNSNSGGLSNDTNSVTNNNQQLVNNSVTSGSTATMSNIEPTGHVMVEVPLAIEGYCPVMLCKKEEWIPGNPAYYAMYRGQVYRFSSHEAMAEFIKSPLRFAPVAMGEDVVMMIDRNKRVCGSRKYGVWYGERVYLFASKESLNSFTSKAEHYANIAQSYESAFKSPLDTVQR
ncbi:MAG: DUF3508 domain-containing protein [Planctomycetaceae bacterium]|jgi:YHS domain-containing protein/thioredoxin-related protein|nr:DUF3508 domain-containing protein [Planctomycetaceae bacterium]